MFIPTHQNATAFTISIALPAYAEAIAFTSPPTLPTDTEATPPNTLLVPSASSLPTSLPTSLPATFTNTAPRPEYIRHLLFGTPAIVQATIRFLHHLGYAEPNDWSRLLSTGRPNEVMAILTKRVNLP